ncbi:hypothetical protein CCH79_00018665 [Gambusia affinis]|uniref:Uncharacterized protein n=1 Tax=Gambusia affinis TaxID=33528 RepID=A0A315V9U1_GAMAF|nr:hypothetical protein CCH79_00018665 [Gambusia affinis]
MDLKHNIPLSIFSFKVCGAVIHTAHSKHSHISWLNTETNPDQKDASLWGSDVGSVMQDDSDKEEETSCALRSSPPWILSPLGTCEPMRLKLYLTTNQKFDID